MVWLRFSVIEKNHYFPDLQPELLELIGMK
jgi:hypothetical protein